MSELVLETAEKAKVKLRLALIGPTGSGKTFSALKLAMGLGGKIGVIDTERRSASLYAKLCPFQVVNVPPPYTVDKYRQAIRLCENAGCEIIIIDSLTHAWSGEGGLLDKQGTIAKRMEQSGGGNSYTAWREVTPDHNRFVEQILGSSAHIIATMRVKTEYMMEKNEKGKMVPRKVGLQPIQRDGMEYEFTVVMDIDVPSHLATASKDRTMLFDGWADRITPDTGKMLLDWLNDGEEPEPLAPPPPKRTSKDFLAELNTRLMAMTTEDEFTALSEDPKVKWAFANFSNGAAAELAAIWAEARERLDTLIGSAEEPVE